VQLEIIKASTSDKEELLDLSGLFNDDYLEYVLDHWLNQEEGGVYLVRHDNTLTACCCLSFPSESEGWLQGLRVHPRYRQLGIASLLTTHLTGLAKTKGIDSIRLLSNPGNQQAQRVAAKAGFSIRGPVREVIYLKPLPGSNVFHQSNPLWHKCRSGDLGLALSYVNRSPGELVFCPGYMYRALTENCLRILIEREAVYFLPDGKKNWRGMAVCLEERIHNHLLCAYINTLPGFLSAFGSLLSCLPTERYFSISMFQEQHRVLRPFLNQLFGDYEYEPWVVMEMNQTERT
jgi:GNAT superfamily N-acetyltransferase